MFRKATLFAFVLAFCLVPAALAAEGPFVIGFSEFNMGNSWRTQSMEEAKYAASQNKDVKELVVTQAEADVSKQIADIEDLIAKKVDAIIINAGSPKALNPVIAKAVAAGITVVDFDSVTESDKSYHLTIDQHEFGRVLADWLAKTLNGKGDIVVFNGMKGTKDSADRFGGAESVFSKHPGIKIVQTVNADWDYAKAKRAMETIFASNLKIDGIWSQGGAMSQAVIDAYTERGQEPPFITGEDNNGFFKAWKKTKDKYPKFDSIATSCPTWISAAAMELALDVLKGKKVEKETILPVPVTTSENIDKYVKMDLPDSYWCNSRLPEDVVKKLFVR
ncbi:MAG: ABC transporter substrate-binding protein [Synergistaceae bacterium]|jgi:ribose transport system substrate-binding protein|nr:ABC transporter substrate-binding protein [Synergistaceae bacterium]